MRKRAEKALSVISGILIALFLRLCHNKWLIFDEK